jgi:hypothetical protein
VLGAGACPTGGHHVLAGRRRRSGPSRASSTTTAATRRAKARRVRRTGRRGRLSRLASAIGLADEPFPSRSSSGPCDGSRAPCVASGRSSSSSRTSTGRSRPARAARTPGAGDRRVARPPVCPTRPELLEQAPDWGRARGRRGSSSTRSTPRQQGDDRGACSAGARSTRRPRPDRGRAEGNPLFASSSFGCSPTRRCSSSATAPGSPDATSGAHRAPDDPGAPRRTPRHARARRALGDRACLGRRLRLPQRPVGRSRPPDVSPVVRSSWRPLTHKHLVDGSRDGEDGLIGSTTS